MKKQSVLVIGHADADGHLIAEQTRRNLALIKNFNVAALVDPEITRDHKAWTRLDEIKEIERADVVFFVDLMFASASFAQEANALVRFVSRWGDKQFYLIDHHPLPMRRLDAAHNLRYLYRPNVFDCVIGPRSGMMIIAALLEGQADKVADIKEPVHEKLATGMRRAAALGGKLPGKKLLALLRANCWKGLLDLGTEDRALHRLPRGRRPIDQPKSKALESLNRTASKLLVNGSRGKQGEGRKHERRSAVAYDIADVAQERFSYETGHRTRLSNMPAARARDLETIVTLLEVAALTLTTTPDETFSRTQLIAKAGEISGNQIELQDEDVDIVLKKQSFLESINGQLRLR